MRICQDQLADCFATEVVSDPVAYAELLVHFAKQRCFPCTAAALTMTQGQSKLARRVLSLLDDNYRLGMVHRRSVFSACLLVLAAVAIALGTFSFRGAGRKVHRMRRTSPRPQRKKALNSTPQADPPQFAKLSLQAAQYAAKPGFDIDNDPLPAGVIARLGTKCFRPGNESPDRDIDRLTFLPDSKTLAQMSSDGRLQLWDSTTGQSLKKTLITDQNAYAAASTPDGHWMVIGSFRKDEARQDFVNSFQLIDTQTHQLPLRWEVVEEPFDRLAISPDGGTVAWGRTKISLFDVARQTEIPGRAIAIAGGQRGFLGFAPDSKTLAIGAAGKVLLWNWASKEEPRSVTVPAHPRVSPHMVHAAAFSPDGKLIAAGTDEMINRFVLADTDTGKVVRSLTVKADESWRLASIAFSPDGKQLAVNASGGACAVGCDNRSANPTIAAAHRQYVEPSFFTRRPTIGWSYLLYRRHLRLEPGNRRGKRSRSPGTY